MNPSILAEYRAYRQSPSAQGLYPLAEYLGLLCYPEPQTGQINHVRFGQINLRMDEALNNPERTLKASLYQEFSYMGVLDEIRAFGYQEIHLELLLETISRSWLQNHPIEDAIEIGCQKIHLDVYTFYACQPGGFEALEDGVDHLVAAIVRAVQRIEIECFGQFADREVA